MTTFDRNQVREFITSVEDDLAEFVGAEFCAARLAGNISQQHAMGDLSDDAAAQLLDDIYHLARLIVLGKKYTRMARNPAPEMRIMVLADEARERRVA